MNTETNMSTENGLGTETIHCACGASETIDINDDLGWCPLPALNGWRCPKCSERAYDLRMKELGNDDPLADGHVIVRYTNGKRWVVQSFATAHVSEVIRMREATRVGNTSFWVIEVRGSIIPVIQQVGWGLDHEWIVVTIDETGLLFGIPYDDVLGVVSAGRSLQGCEPNTPFSQECLTNLSVAASAAMRAAGLDVKKRAMSIL